MEEAQAPTPEDRGAGSETGSDPAPRSSRAAYVLAHVSDIHFGAIADIRVVDALVEAINSADVDVVCLSGDLTQRARHREFSAAQAMIERFTAPVIVVPGNHDVYAWWSPFKRVFRPLRRYRELITNNLTPTFEQAGALEQAGLAVLGVNSAHGRTRKGGYVSSRMRAAMQAFFGGKPDGTFKVLVLHHHLLRLSALGHHDVARRATRTLALARMLGVDLILCGHLHVSHVEHVEAVGTTRRVVIASAGTATSTRGRHAHRGVNFFNIVHVAPKQFEVAEQRFDPEAGRFAEVQRRTFAR